MRNATGCLVAAACFVVVPLAAACGAASVAAPAPVAASSLDVSTSTVATTSSSTPLSTYVASTYEVDLALASSCDRVQRAQLVYDVTDAAPIDDEAAQQFPVLFRQAADMAPARDALAESKFSMAADAAPLYVQALQDNNASDQDLYFRAVSGAVSWCHVNGYPSPWLD